MPVSLTVACTATLPAVLMVTLLPIVAVALLSLSVHATAAPSLKGTLLAKVEAPLESVLVLSVSVSLRSAFAPDSCWPGLSLAPAVAVLALVLLAVLSVSDATVMLPLLTVGLEPSVAFDTTVCRLTAPAMPTEPVLLLAVAEALVVKLLVLWAPMSSEFALTAPLTVASASTAA